jgi:FkbM family methyltransferase
MPTKLFEIADGVSLYVSSTVDAQFIYDEIFKEGCYDAIALPSAPFVVDVGAHIGVFALFMTGRAPGAEIVAFEPSPETADLLRRNIELHGLAGVAVHQIALGAIAERAVTFTHYAMAPGNSTRYPQDKELQKTVMARTISPRVVERVHLARELTVDVERLASYLPAGRRVDLLKIDVEGAELDVLRGIDPPQWPLIQQVLVEVQDLNGRLRAVTDLLSGHGFTLTVSPAPMADPDYLMWIVQARR